MSLNINGLIYEQKVFNSIKKANTNIQVIGDAPSGGFNAHDTDMKLKIGNDIFDLEIKADSKAQMGGTSFTYNMENKLFESVKEISSEDNSLIQEEMKEYTNYLDTLIQSVKKHSPVSYNSNNTGFPLATTKETWESIKNEGLLLPLNTKIKKDTTFLHDHYAKKGVYYIQIGGSGLFYLKENILNLPVPQLEGEMNLEIRPGRSGSKLREYKGNYYNFCGVGLRIQGRLKFNGKSDYTLDDPKSIEELSGRLNIIRNNLA